MDPMPDWLSHYVDHPRRALHRLILRKRGGHTRRSSIRLPMGGLWSGIARRGVRLRCSEGVAWVTVAGDARDYILHVEQQVVLRTGGRLVVQALGSRHLVLAIDDDGANQDDAHA